MGENILWSIPLFGGFCGETIILSMLHKHLWILVPTISFFFFLLPLLNTLETQPVQGFSNANTLLQSSAGGVS